MTTPQTVEEQTPEPDHIQAAIAALTSAARAQRTVAPGTPSEHREPVDFAEIACYVITATAANAGGVEQLLAGRPGSWEADYIRQIVLSVAGDDPAELFRYRTEPLRLEFDEFHVEELFHDFGLGKMFEEATEAFATSSNTLDAELYDAWATPEEKQELEEIQSKINLSDLDAALMDDALRIREAVFNRATAADDPRLASLHASELAGKKAWDLWEQDMSTYREAYVSVIRKALTERGITLEVEVVESSDELPHDQPLEWDLILEDLHEQARKTTPLPMTGQAPDWSDGRPADALRRAGLTYKDRCRP